MITVLYRANSEHARDVEQFLAELKHQRIAYKTIDVDSKEAASLIELYDLLQYPAVLATSPDGSPLQTWKGSLPLLSEIGYYAHA